VNDNKLRLQCEKTVKGAVLCLSELAGKLAAAINTKVVLFSMDYSSEVRSLKQVGEQGGNVMVLCICTRGDFILVADIVKSLTLLAYSAVDGSLKEISRDYNPNWMTAAEIQDDENFLGGENSFNLFSLSKNSGGVTEDERGRLDITGEFYLGEMVNRFRHGSLVMKPPEGEGVKVETTLFGTVSGTIGIVSRIPQEIFAQLLRVEKAMEKINTIGGFSNEEFRQFSSERKVSPSRGFIDGDLIESYMELSPELMSSVAKEAGISTEKILRTIESLSRALH